MQNTPHRPPTISPLPPLPPSAQNHLPRRRRRGPAPTRPPIDDLACELRAAGAAGRRTGRPRGGLHGVGQPEFRASRRFRNLDTARRQGRCFRSNVAALPKTRRRMQRARSRRRPGAGRCRNGGGDRVYLLRLLPYLPTTLFCPKATKSVAVKN